jgi:DICT domain-containing protein
VTDTLETLVGRVEATTQTFSIVNYDGPAEKRARIASYFEPQSVEVREGVTDASLPRNFAVLHDGEEFVAAASVEDVHRHVAGDAMFEDDFGAVERPAVLEHVDDRTFTSYDMGQMLLASHEIERYAHRVGEGELHAGFQHLSTLESQTHIYEKLRDTDVDVHVYGEGDADVPAGLVEHASEAEEILGSWFVVFDADRSPVHTRALVAVETGDRTFTGFWTYENDTVDDVLARLRDQYPATREAGTPRSADD